MASNIDPTKPLDGVPAVKSDLRTNLATAKSEIEALQTSVDDIQSSIPVSAAEYGALPDGAVTPAANATALHAMRDALLAIQQAAGSDDNAPHFDIHLPAGLYQLDQGPDAPGFWTQGLLNFTLHAYGAKLQSLVGGGSTHNRIPIGNSLPHFGTRSRSTGLGTWQTGRLIDTVEAGDTAIAFKTAGEASDFIAGGRALIYGFDGQGNSAPPNTHYFEWVYVDTVDAGAGTINLKKALRHRYDENWPITPVSASSASPCGPAMIIPLHSVYSVDGNSDFFFPSYIHIKGLTLLRNPNNPIPNYDPLLLSADRLYLTDCDLVNWTPSGNRIAEGRNCRIDDRVEGDKLVEQLICKDFMWQGTLTQNTRIPVVKVLGGTMDVGDWTSVGDSMSCSGQDFEMRGVTVFGSPDGTPSTMPLGHPGGHPQRSAVIEGNTFYTRSASNPPAAFSGSVQPTVTVTGTNGNNDILITQNDANSNLWRKLEIGRILYNQATGVGGRITAMDADGTNLRIAGTWTTTPVASEVWQQHLIGRLSDRNNVLVGLNGTQPLRFSVSPYLSNEAEVKTIRLTSAEIDFGRAAVTVNDALVWGSILRINVDVLSASNAGSLQINPRDAADVFLGVKTFDLTQTGRRTITPSGTVGAVGTDNLNTTGLGQWIKSVSINFTGGTPDKDNIILEMDIAGPI